MANGYFEEMRARGFSYNTTASVRKKLKCPSCGFEFSLVYARAVACQGCSEAICGCPKVRCARCDSEFFLQESPDIHTKMQERDLADHINRIIVERNSDLGVVSAKR